MSDKAWRQDRLVQGYVAAYGGREDARPRPRLEWVMDLVGKQSRRWCLLYGENEMAGILVRRDGIDVMDYTSALCEHPLFTSLRDAAINLRLRFIAQGFDVDDVPDEILGGGA